MPRRQAYPACREATSVTVRRIDIGLKNRANWDLQAYNPGRAQREKCDFALKLILPIVQRHFDLAADA